MKQQCKSCRYWMSLSGQSKKDCACLQILFTDKKKRTEGGTCLSMAPKVKKPLGRPKKTE